MGISIKSKMRTNDIHIVVNGESKNLTTYSFAGKQLFNCEARCYGQHNDWTAPNGDTPPGLYEVGIIYDTTGETPYGEWCVDLIDLEGQETGNGRAGISLHGGGSGLADPFSPYQGWQSTHGCIRVQNAELEKIVGTINRTKKAGGRVFLTVVYPKGKLD